MIGWILIWILAALQPSGAELPERGVGEETSVGQETPVRLGERLSSTGEALDVDRLRLPELGARLLRVEADQGTADLTLILRTPEGDVLAEIDEVPRDHPGHEVLVAQSPADAVLEVHFRRRGTYTLWVEAIEPFDPANPGLSDRRRHLAAERFATQAGTLRALASETASHEALGLYRKAADRFAEAGDLDRQTWIEHHLGGLWMGLGEPDKAVDQLTIALELWRRLGDRAGEASSLLVRGVALGRRSEVERARADAAMARQLFADLGVACGEARALNNLGRLQQGGDLQAANAYFEQALDLCGGGTEPELEAALLLNTGGAQAQLGEPQEAITRSRQALDWLERLGDARLALRTRVNLGVYSRRLGRLRDAFDWYHLALEGAQELGDGFLEASIHNSLGSIYRYLGELERAEDHLSRALTLRRRVGDRRGEAVTLANLGRVALNRAPFAAEAAAEARRWLTASVQLRRELGRKRSLTLGLTLLAEAERWAGDGAAARRHLTEAEGLAQALDDAGLVASLALERGHLALEEGTATEAVEPLRAASDSWRQRGQRLELVDSLSVLAQAQRLVGDLAAARRTLDEAQGLAESLRLEVGDPELRASFFGAVHAVAEEEVALNLDRHRADPTGGYAARAFEASEAGRARGLVELLSQAETGARLDADPVLWERRQELLRQASAKASRARRLKSGDPRRQRLEAELATGLESLRAIEATLRQDSPAWQALDASPPTVADVSAMLDEDTVLLEIALGATESVLWVVTHTGMTLHTLPSRRQLEAAVGDALPVWRTQGAWGEAEHRRLEHLSTLLLAPAAEALATAQRLVIVADGGLHTVPFAALPVPGSGPSTPGGGEPLVERFEVVHLPSAAVLQFLRRTRRAAAGEGVTVFADPVFQADDPRLEGRGDASQGARTDLPRLPASRREAEAILALAGDRGTVFLDTEAHPEVLTEGQVDGSRVLHFATHGVLDTRYPRLSGLELSRFDARGRPVDGFLSLGALYDLQLDAELVVLSGCRTALGRQVRGEGVVGLPRGFLHSGARAVVASLWQVQDRATARLMEAFYRALLVEGQRPAAALRHAQGALRRDPLLRHPYHWAGFILVGDWQ